MPSGAVRGGVLEARAFDVLCSIRKVSAGADPLEHCGICTSFCDPTITVSGATAHVYEMQDTDRDMTEICTYRISGFPCVALQGWDGCREYLKLHCRKNWLLCASLRRMLSVFVKLSRVSRKTVQWVRAAIQDTTASQRI